MDVRDMNVRGSGNTTDGSSFRAPTDSQPPADGIEDVALGALQRSPRMDSISNLKRPVSASNQKGGLWKTASNVMGWISSKFSLFGNKKVAPGLMLSAFEPKTKEGARLTASPSEHRLDAYNAKREGYKIFKKKIESEYSKPPVLSSWLSSQTKNGRIVSELKAKKYELSKYPIKNAKKIEEIEKKLQNYPGEKIFYRGSGVPKVESGSARREIPSQDEREERMETVQTKLKKAKTDKMEKFVTTTQGKKFDEEVGALSEKLKKRSLVKERLEGQLINLVNGLEKVVDSEDVSAVAEKLDLKNSITELEGKIKEIEGQIEGLEKEINVEVQAFVKFFKKENKQDPEINLELRQLSWLDEGVKVWEKLSNDIDAINVFLNDPEMTKEAKKDLKTLILPHLDAYEKVVNSNGYNVPTEQAQKMADLRAKFV